MFEPFWRNGGFCIGMSVFSGDFVVAHPQLLVLLAERMLAVPFSNCREYNSSQKGGPVLMYEFAININLIHHCTTMFHVVDELI